MQSKRKYLGLVTMTRLKSQKMQKGEIIVNHKSMALATS